MDRELFWAIKGGGGGSFGVVTKLTLRTHEFPAFFGAVFATVKASSPEAFRRLIAKTIAFYADHLFNPHWGEQIVVRPNRELGIGMVFQGLGQQQAESVWRPFFDWIRNAPQDFAIAANPVILAAPARDFWSPRFLKQLPGWCWPMIVQPRRRAICSGRATEKRQRRSFMATGLAG